MRINLETRKQMEKSEGCIANDLKVWGWIMVQEKLNEQCARAYDDADFYKYGGDWGFDNDKETEKACFVEFYGNDDRDFGFYLPKSAFNDFENLKAELNK